MVMTKAKQYTSVIVKAWIGSILLSAILLIGFSVIMYLTESGTKTIHILVYVTYICSGIAGGWLAGKKAENRKFLWGLAAGILYYLTLLIVSILIGNIENQSFSVHLSVILMCFGSGMLGGMLA